MGSDMLAPLSLLRARLRRCVPVRPHSRPASIASGYSSFLEVGHFSGWPSDTLAAMTIP